MEVIKFCVNVNGVGMVESTTNKKGAEPSFWQVLVSTTLSFFGVSGESPPKRGFKLGSLLLYVVGGFVLVLGFIVVVMGIFKWVLALIVG